MGLLRPAAVVVVVVVAVVDVAFVSGCATAHADIAEKRNARRLRALERSFHAFTATRLRDLDDVEAATAALEQLRMDYLDVLAPVGDARDVAPVDERDQLLALLRLAELHLDLGARIRRVPYPVGSDEAHKRQFDVRLSALALPLEAIGQGVLEQIMQRADRADVDGRFVHRARLYLHLHALSDRGVDGHLDADDVATLQRELLAQTFRAPRSLLEAGRVGQRAARR